MKKILFIVSFLFFNIAYTQSIDFVYVNLKDCNKDCRNNFKVSLTSIIENTDSIFLYVSNAQNPEVFSLKEDIKSNIDRLLRKQYQVPILLEDLKLVSNYLNDYNFIDLTTEPDEKINFHFYFESNRFVRNNFSLDFINQILLSNNCIVDKSLKSYASVLVYFKDFQVKTSYNLRLKNKKQDIKNLGYEVKNY
jgi:hypothetical protein